jgi:hypothetical protein
MSGLLVGVAVVLFAINILVFLYNRSRQAYLAEIHALLDKRELYLNKIREALNERERLLIELEKHIREQNDSHDSRTT